MSYPRQVMLKNLVLLSSKLLATDIERRSQNSYASCVMASSAMELPLGVFGCLSTTYAETNTNKMRRRSLRTVQRFTHVYLQAQAAVHTHLMNHGYFDCWNNLNTPTEVPCQDKDGASSGISSLYL